MCWWKYFVMTGMFKSVTHKFFVPGHSYMASDSDFGMIEQKQRWVQNVYTHEEWMKIIATARKIKPFTVIEMKKESMLHFTPLTKVFVNRKQHADKTKFYISKITAM